MKELIPLAIFSLLIIWLVASWGAPWVGVGNRQFLSNTPTEVVASITATPTTFQTATPTASSTATSRPSPTPTQTPTSPPTNTPTSDHTPTPTAIPLPSVIPTPELVWQGRVAERTQTGAGTIGVRAVYLNDHPVILYSGGFQFEPQLTGTKPELGNFGTEFGGLGEGDYVVELLNLAKLKVTLGPGEYILVEFQQTVTDSP